MFPHYIDGPTSTSTASHGCRSAPAATTAGQCQHRSPLEAWPMSHQLGRCPGSHDVSIPTNVRAAKLVQRISQLGSRLLHGGLHIKGLTPKPKQRQAYTISMQTARIAKVMGLTQQLDVFWTTMVLARQISWQTPMHHQEHAVCTNVCPPCCFVVWHQLGEEPPKLHARTRQKGLPRL